MISKLVKKKKERKKEKEHHYKEDSQFIFKLVAVFS